MRETIADTASTTLLCETFARDLPRREGLKVAGLRCSSVKQKPVAAFGTPDHLPKGT